MTNKLKEHFPIIRDREEVEAIIQNDKQLKAIFEGWEKERQKEFLDFCSGARGMKILYDSFFKEVMNPEYDPGRLENFLSVLLKRKVRIHQIVTNDGTRIAEEASLLITDIIVELEDGSFANVEVQKIGYNFPGERSACYSADMLLRQYKRIRSRNGEKFSYHQIKNVYLIVIYETSPKEFKLFPQEYFHHSRQVFDTGLQLNLLQEYIMIPLDIYHRNMQNKPIETILEAWLTFLASDDPERIIELISRYPEFKPLYETLYQMCRNVEGVMGFFSEELRMMDRNMVKLMIEEQQKELEKNEEKLQENKEKLQEQEGKLQEQKGKLQEQKGKLQEQEEKLQEQKEKLQEQEEKLQEQEGKLQEQEGKLQEQEGKLQEQEGKLTEQKERLIEQDEKLEKQKQEIEKKDAEIEILRKELEKYKSK